MDKGIFYQNFRKRLTLSECGNPLAIKNNYSRDYHIFCPRCNTTNTESRDCKQFLGYSSLARLKEANRLTNCLEIIEGQGFSGSTAIFRLVMVGGEA